MQPFKILKSKRNFEKNQSNHFIIEDFFISEDNLEELQTGKHVAIFFEKEKFLQKNRHKKIFKKVLQEIGRNDLVIKVEKYIGRGESY